MLLGLSRNVALRIDKAMKFAARRNAVEDLDATDFDQPVALLRIEARRFRVENDLAHHEPFPRLSISHAKNARKRRRGSLAV